MNVQRRHFVLPALCAVSLAACGSSAALPSPSQATSLAAWRAAVQCARGHGMTWLPDPVIGSDGRVTLPGVTKPTPTPAVQRGCATQIRAIEPSVTTPASERPADTAALLRVAECLRKHGLSHWPDPDPSYPGTFHVKSADAGNPWLLGRAANACRRLIPDNGWHLVITPTGQ